MSLNVDSIVSISIGDQCMDPYETGRCIHSCQIYRLNRRTSEDWDLGGDTIFVILQKIPKANVRSTRRLSHFTPRVNIKSPEEVKMVFQNLETQPQRPPQPNFCTIL